MKTTVTFDDDVAAEIQRLRRVSDIGVSKVVNLLIRSGIGRTTERSVALSVRVFAQASDARVHHLRTKAGEREIDVIVERPDRRVLPIEVELAQTVEAADVRHLRWLGDELGTNLLDAAVITTGPEAYRRQDGIAVIPAALLGP